MNKSTITKALGATVLATTLLATPLLGNVGQSVTGNNVNEAQASMKADAIKDVHSDDVYVLNPSATPKGFIAGIFNSGSNYSSTNKISTFVDKKEFQVVGTRGGKLVLSNAGNTIIMEKSSALKKVAKKIKPLSKGATLSSSLAKNSSFTKANDRVLGTSFTIKKSKQTVYVLTGPMKGKAKIHKDKTRTLTKKDSLHIYVKGFVKEKGTLYAVAHYTPNTLLISPIEGPVYIPASQLVAE